MQTLTIAIFENDDFTGGVQAATARAVPETETTALAHSAAHDATLVRVRPNDELILELTPLLRGRHRAVMDAFPDNVSLTSGLRAGMVWTRALDGFDSFSPLTFFVDLNFRIEIDLPAGRNIACFGRDVTGTVHFFVDVFLDGGELRTRVVGARARLTGGGWCLKHRIKPRVEDALGDGVQLVQTELDALLGMTAGLAFSDVYLLPGDGEYDGIERVADPRQAAALILVRT